MRRRRCVLIIGPTPPPYHGMSIYTRQLVGSPVLRAAWDVVHLDTADRRPLDNMGRLEARNVVLAVRHAAALAWRIVRHRPTVVYVEVSQNAWAYVRDAVFILVACALGRRVVTHLHGSELRVFYERANPAVRWLVRFTSRRLAGAAVLSPGLREIYRGLVPEDRVHVVPNGVEDPVAGKAGEGAFKGTFDGGPERAVGRTAAVGGAVAVEGGGEARGCVPGGGEGVADGAAKRVRQVTVAYLGMLYERKGFLDLLRAAALLRDAEPAVRFVFAGEWFSAREREAAAALVEAHGLEGRVSFPGRVDGEAKREFLLGSDIFVFPSVQAEGLPLVILEAMAAGVPVVSTDTGAVRDVVADGETGVLVEKGSPQALAAAIRSLARDGELRARMGRAARQRYLGSYTDVRAAERLVEFLEAACAAG